MQYKTRAFEPNVAGGDSAAVAAALETMIQVETAGGWEYVAVENHSTVIPGNPGCFGIGATAPYPKTFAIVVFRR